jgi:transcriptional regulator with XRE-family HTH domain
MKLGTLVARRLRRVRRERGFSQEELAGRAGLNRNYVGMVEREENSPTIETLEKLAAALEVHPKLFFEEGPEMSSGSDRVASAAEHRSPKRRVKRGRAEKSRS